MPESMREVRPIDPVAPYLGGKRHLAKRIIRALEAIDHVTYAEPFVGMAGVFLRRKQAARAEVINDWNKELATFYRVIQRHYPQFRDTLKFQISSRTEFERLIATDPETLTDLERAARFLYLQRTAFGGKISGRNFGVSPERPGRFDVTKLGPLLEDLHERLAAVTIECLPYAAFIERYDRPGTLFYLDPPYWGGERDYGRGLFERADFERLATILAEIRGRFVLSLNDVPEIRTLFGAFTIEAVETTYSVAKAGNGMRAAELLISN